MSTGKHYFIEKHEEGFKVTAAGAKRASTIEKTQAAGIAAVKRFNPDDHPNVERVEKTTKGKPPGWRSATKKPKK